MTRCEPSAGRDRDHRNAAISPWQCGRHGAFTPLIVGLARSPPADPAFGKPQGKQPVHSFPVQVPAGSAYTAHDPHLPKARPVTQTTPKLASAARLSVAPMMDWTDTL
jgi:hypothetical protein